MFAGDDSMFDLVYDHNGTRKINFLKIKYLKITFKNILKGANIFLENTAKKRKGCLYFC